MKIYIICCVPAQILFLGKVLFNQTAGFLNQIFLQGKSIKQPHFLHVDIDSQKLNVNRKGLVGPGQKWVCPAWSVD